ncbi:MAG: tetratricopeptide repeat protein [Algoriphagus sp.]|nr:tetratricopeptide repeat protein [Algoriphagus sp.]
MRYFLFLLLMSPSLLTMAQAVTKSADRRQIGLEAFDQNDLPKAFGMLDSWLSDHPDDGEIYLYRARIWNQFKNPQKADIDYTAYLQFFPDHGEVYLERGRARFQSSLYELAKQDFEAFLQLPRGETSQVIYRKSAAAAGFSQVFTAQTPNPAQAYFHLGLCSIELKEFEQAVVYLDSAIRYQADEPDFYAEKGKALALQGEKEEAKLNYEKALDLNPDHYLSRQRMAFLTQSSDEEALEALTQSIASAPENPEPFKQRGYYRLSHRDPSGAKDDFLQALSMEPDDAQLWFYLGSSWVGLKNFKEAEKAFSKALEHDPQNVEYLLHRGQSRYRMSEFDHALADFTLVTFYDPDYDSGFYHKGITLQRISGGKTGCPDLRKAMDLGMEEAKTAWQKACGQN